jgi:hypothetical protein
VRYAFLFGVRSASGRGGAGSQEGVSAANAVKLEDRNMPAWEDYVRVAAAFDDAFLAEAEKIKAFEAYGRGSAGLENNVMAEENKAQMGAEATTSQSDTSWRLRRGSLQRNGDGAGAGAGAGGGSVGGVGSDGGEPESVTARGNSFTSMRNVWGSLMTLMDPSAHGSGEGSRWGASRGGSRRGGGGYRDPEESTHRSNRYNFRGDESTHRGSRFMIAASNTVGWKSRAHLRQTQPDR